MSHGLDQLGERFEFEPIGAELHMAGFVRRHEQIEALIFRGRWIAAEQRRQGNDLPIFADRRPGRSRDRIR